MTPVPAFYHRPSTIQDIVDKTVNRSLDLLGVSSNGISSSDGKEHQSRGQVRAVVNQMQLNSRKEHMMSTSSRKLTINTSKYKVFKAITTEQGLKGWYSPKVEGKPDKGGEVTLSFSEHEGTFRWKVAEEKPNSLVRWESVAGPGQATGTVATFRLSDKGDGRTVVELDHDGFKESDEKLKTCNTLCGGLIIHLKKYVEAKKTESAPLR
jgi:uncharacterized protein YndB with AHSA1/START domain